MTVPNEAFWHPSKSRQIAERIVVEGELVLLSPAHFGAGDSSDDTNLPLLRDSFDPTCPLLTGSSLAGALRAYLRRVTNSNHALDVALFGGAKGDEDGEQSPLIVDDAIGVPAEVELRDGVKLDPHTCTAADQALFSIETWAAGARFPLRFELLLFKHKDNTPALQALAAALTGLTNGEIAIGKRKQRGYGAVRVSCWRVRRYRLADSADDLIAWLREGNAPLRPDHSTQVCTMTDQGQPHPDDRIMRDLLCAFGAQDVRSVTLVHTSFEMRATFALCGSIMIRGNTGRDDVGPDLIHLHARRRGERRPVLSGTSLAGALRSRALRILNTFNPNRARQIVDDLFGPDLQDRTAKPHASRLITAECEIDNAITDLIQSRIRIDRFTGGVVEGALFDEQPAFACQDTRLTLTVRIRNPKAQEIGLLLLLLKDLWTGDLPLGGEIGIGRGRLQGIKADLVHRDGQRTHEWRIEQTDNRLTLSGDRAQLEGFVAALHKSLAAQEASHAA